MLQMRDALTAAAQRLAAAGVPSARFDAEELAAHVLGTERARLVTVDAMTEAQREKFDQLVDERARRVPLQHLTGVAGFRYLELAVGPGVFTPRPETELLAGWGIEAIAGLTAPVVVDLCAGSGAIALSIAHECPGAIVYAVEREEHAVAWASRNAETRRALGDRPIELVHADATAPATLAELDGSVDVVLTNPPYIPDGSVVTPEVADHDPAAALWGGPDGLAVVRLLVARAARLLRPGGLIGIEHADVQGAAVPAVLRAAGGWHEIADHRDLAGRDRFSTARRDDDTMPR